jgi:hypothetical protein
VACPYFFPTEKSTVLYWPFPQRLPLGAGFHGSCTAEGAHSAPGELELREFCNVGYAGRCGKLPAGRRSDAVRFSIALEKDETIIVRYVCERDHAPVEHGELKYDVAAKAWQAAHADPILMRQAECYVASYFERKLK